MLEIKLHIDSKINLVRPRPTSNESKLLLLQTRESVPEKYKMHRLLGHYTPVQKVQN